jgi:REP element-mobilizing transposase RayT
MPNYRRAFVPGGCWFFTVNLLERRNSLLAERIDALRDAIQRTDEADDARHVEYCYINPVKHGLVARVRDWPHSSFHRDARAGIFPEDWAGDVGRIGEFGERD